MSDAFPLDFTLPDSIPTRSASTESLPSIGTFVPTPLPELDEADFGRFRDALPERAARIRIGLHLSEGDAELLLRHPEWQEMHYRQWIGEAVANEPGAPVGLPRIAEPQPTPPTPAKRRPTRRPGAKRTRPVRRPVPAVGDQAA